MKGVLLAMAIACVLPVSVPHSAVAAERTLAPADRYFGRTKMSILGIRNTLQDCIQRADEHPETSGDLYGRILLVDDALHDWQRAFPRDPWLPKFTCSLAQVYRMLASDQAQERMATTMDWLIATYPTSVYAAMDP